MRILSDPIHIGQWDFQNIYIKPAKEGIAQFSMAFGFEPSTLENIPPLINRVAHFALGTALLIPILNTIIYVALSVLTNHPNVQERPPLSKHELVQQLNAWKAQGSPGELREEATRRILACFDTSSRDLDLSCLQLKSLPDDISILTQLERLDLAYNQLATLPEQIGNLTELKDLDLNANQLATLPEQIGNLTQLKVLNLNANQLAALPKQIGNLTQLKDLNLSSNQLAALPEQIGNLTQLKKLWLHNNQLTALPEQIGNLTQLKDLALYNNQLAALPEQIENLTQLEKLWLQNNQLAALPEQIENLTQLKDLTLYNNQLAALPEQIGNLTQLERLNLSNNQLTALPEQIGNLTQLTFLVLRNNQLAALPDSFFTLPEHCSVDLEGNRFPTAEVETLQQRVAGRFTVRLSVYEPAGYVPRANLPRTFEQTIASLTEAMGQDPVVMQELNFTHDQKDAFLAFMNKMGNSKVYKNQAKPITARLVADCLNLASTNEVFEGVFFAVCDEGSNSCGDRVALSVNHLYIQHCLHTKFPEDLSPVEFVVGLKRLDLLYKEAEKFINNYVGGIDAIEVHLALQVRLRKRLKLPVYAKDMLYFGCSSLTQDDIDRIGTEVEATTQDPATVFEGSKIWEKYITEHFNEEYLNVTQIYECPDHREGETDKEFRARIDLVTTYRNAAIAEFIKDKTEKLLRQEQLQHRRPS